MSDEKTPQVPPERGEGFVPDQVRRAGARADELQRQIHGGGDSTPPDETPPTAPPESLGEQPQPVEGPEVPPPPPQQGEWEQRYRTLQGKYDSEMGAMRGQVAQLERLLATVQQPPQQPPQQQAPQQLPPGQYNEADLELYGQDLLDAAGRAADARYARQMTEMRNEIQQLKGNQVQGQAQITQDRVFRELDVDPELAGYWRQLNNDPRFIEWLQGIDEYSGLSRNDMLQHAYTNGDAMRTGRFFKKYMAEHTAPQSLPVTTSQTGNGLARDYQSGNGYQPAGGPRLEDLAAPGRAAGSGAGYGAPQLRLWSRSEIKRFYDDRTHGRFRGREAEAERLEADLNAAQREGRIV